MQLLFPWSLNDLELDDGVADLVNCVWAEAVGEVERCLSAPISTVSLESVLEAEGRSFDCFVFKIVRRHYRHEVYQTILSLFVASMQNHDH